MAILLAGGAGYIGTHMLLELLEKGYEVVVCDNLRNSTREGVKRVEDYTKRKVKFYEYDLCDINKLEEVFKNNHIDCIIHFAGLKAAGESVEKPLEYYENNLTITMNLCKTMLKFDVTKIIFSSSACVYTEGNAMPLTEESQTGNCVNPYGWTKFISEQILRDVANVNVNWSVAILRYFNLIGAHESGIIGESSLNPPKNLPPIIAGLIGGERPLEVYGTDYPTKDGTCIRDYIHVVDLVKGHLAAMSYIESHKGVNAFNLGTGKGTSVLELAEEFENITNEKLKLHFADRRSGDVAESYCSAQKAYDLLGWKTEKTAWDGCFDTMNWKKKNPNGYLDTL